MADDPSLKIRSETPSDRQAIAAVNEAAFDRSAEAQLIEALRVEPGFDPRLSLVAEEDGKVVGHILLSPILIQTDEGQAPALALAPMAVLPERQRSGIGGQLVLAAISAARQIGHGAIIVLGHPEYYPRFGFRPASGWNVRCPFEVPDEAFMLVELASGALPANGGVVEYPAPFMAV